MTKKKWLLGSWTLLTIACTAVLAALVYTSSPGENRDHYAVAETGTIRETVFVAGLFVYDETVVTAADAGTVTLNVNDGDLVAAGSVCGKVKHLNDIFGNGEETLTAPCSGLFYRHTDGWESILTAERLGSLDPAAVFRLYGDDREEGDFRYAGDDCFKLIDAKKDVYLLADVGAMAVAVDDEAELVLKGEPVTATVKALYGAEGRRFALLRIAPLALCYGNRRTEVGWVKEEHSGVVVTAAAIKEHRGEVGVYREEKGKLVFRPVSVLCSDGERCVVSGIKSGDFIFFGKS